MPRQQLTEFQNRLASLHTCFALTKQELDASPVCPHCNFRLVTEPDGKPAVILLKELENELGKLHEAWTKTILTNLEDPVTRKNLALLKPAARTAIEAFVQTRELPDELTNDFVAALQEALSSLIRVTISLDSLRAALLTGGSPATLPELKKRFEDYLDGISKGKEPKKVRVILE
jgi:hypothetical protein